LPIKRIKLSPVVKRTRQEAERATKIATKQFNRARRTLKKTFAKKKNQRRAVVAVLATAAVLSSVGAYSIHANAQQDRHYLRTQLNNRDVELDERKQRSQTLQESLQAVQQQKAETDAQLQKKAQEEAELKRQIDELAKQVSAKREREKQAQVKVASAKPEKAAPRKSTGGAGNCDAWLKAAGVSDMGNAKELISRESGCNPGAVNSDSGACGVAQELPCGKSGCGGDGACQVRWMNDYVESRYGSWSAAVAHHDAKNWY